MPKSKTKFQEKWLSERDPSGHQYLLWCRKGSDEYHVYCFICRKEFAFFVVVVIISVGSNAVAAFTGNNHACLRHKRFTDNDRDQQTYGEAEIIWAGKVPTINFSI
jgi:hypothetical protein